MDLEVTRMLTDWLKDPDDGVNAKLLTLPLDGGDDPVIPVNDILDITRDDVVANRSDPVNDQAIYVMPDASYESEGEVGMNQPNIRRTDGGLSIAIRYLTKVANTARGQRDTRYVIRAILASMAAFSLSEADHIRNQICIERFTSMGHLLVHEAVGAAVVTGAVIVTVDARDINPAF